MEHSNRDIGDARSTKKFVPVLQPDSSSTLVMRQINIQYDAFFIPHKGLALPDRLGFNEFFLRMIVESVQDVPIFSEKVLRDCVEKVNNSIASQGGKFYMQVRRQAHKFPATCWKELSANGSNLIIRKCIIGVAKKRGIRFAKEHLTGHGAALATLFADTLSLRGVGNILGSA